MRWLRAPALALLWLFASEAAVVAGQHPTGPQIWFEPNPNTPNGDFLNLWSDSAPWQQAASKVDVLGIVHEWLLTATDQQILAMANFARARHMKLDLEIEAVTQADTANCPHIEGFVGPTTVATELATLQRLNIQIDILNMDGPLWNGHYGTVPSSCAQSVADLAANVAATIAPIVAQYPAIQVYEIEPDPAMTNFPDWRNSLNDFDQSLAQALGRPIRGLFLDVTWDNPSWLQPLRDVRAFAHERNMQFGWFFNGSQYALSDTEWTNDAQTYFEYLEGTLSIVPDNGIFASWNTYPALNMPETSPAALTSLINRYFRERTALQAQFVGRGARGKLTTAHGKAIANATVYGYVSGTDFSQPLPTKVIQGVVPPNAAFALIGYRLNAECLCSGPNDVLVGPLNFRETQGGSANYTYLLPNYDQNYSGVIVTNEHVGGTIVNRVITTSAQTFLPNSPMIPVDPGAQFTFTIPAATMGREGWYGHVLLLWFDQNQQGLPGSYTIIPPPGQTLVSSATTGIDGSFVLKRLPRIGPGSAQVTIQFPGDATHRPVGWSALPITMPEP